MFAKKNLVAVAALLVVAGAAHAQSSVKLYGYVEASVGSFQSFNLDSGTADRTTRVESGNMMTSFFGLSGVEDLGGGLKAEFVLESFLANDTGSDIKNLANGFWGRGSWVGLSGDFGRVALGQYDNAFFTMGYLYNPFGSSMTFSPTMVSYYSFDGFQTPALAFDTGWTNSITYETPNFGGFTAALQYAPKEGSGGQTRDSWTASAAYNAGPLSVMAVYAKSGQNAFPAYAYRQKNWGVGASYDFGVAKLTAQYSKTEFDYPGENDTSKFFQIGAEVPVSEAGKVMVSYGQTKYNDYYSIGNGFGIGDSKLKQFSLGYDHSLSKRTGVYAAVTSQKLSGDFKNWMDDTSATTYAVGVRHAF